MFAAPYLVAGAAVLLVLASTGELLSLDTVARLQTFRQPFIYETKLSDHSYRLKIAGARLQRPQVLVIGPSRMNGWRSAMFAPLSFYNAGRAAYVQRDFRRMLDDIAPHSPDVVVFSIDFFTLHPQWDPIFKSRSYDDRGGFGSAEQATILRAMYKEMQRDPYILFRNKRDPLYGVPALGMRAGEHGSGIRIDGSFQYGGIVLRRPGQEPETIAGTLRRVAGGFAPFQAADALDPEGMREVERFASTARARGIRLIGLSLPYAPEAVQALDQSPRHGNWRQFQRPETATWLRSLGIQYFNFTSLDSFGGRPDEFVDPFHPSETASIRMLLEMLKDPVCRNWLPGIAVQALRERLANATPLEAYRNDF